MKFRFKTLFSVAVVATLTLTACADKEDTPTPPAPENPIEKVDPASDMIIYEANPRFFATDNCFNAMTGQIDRIADMGCNVLWIMPIYEPGVEKAFGSPYCIKDYKATNPKYGSISDLKKLIEKAHARNMKVILDWVANHTSWDNDWITSNPQFYKKDASGNITAANGWSDVAQLNYSNKDLIVAMEDAMLYWVETVGIDGYRCDYVEGVPHDFWKGIITKLKAKNPDFFMLAESGNNAYYDDGFDAVYDWNLNTTLSKTFNGSAPENYFTAADKSWTKVPQGKTILRYVFNHDVASENDVNKMFGGTQANIAAYALTAMLQGTPLIYSSMDAEQISGKLSFFNYKPLNWSNTLTSQYKAVNAAYKATADIRNGKLITYSFPKVAAFSRSANGKKMLVMINTSAEQQTIKTPMAFMGIPMTDLITNTSITPSTMTTLPPYAITILKTE